MSVPVRAESGLVSRGLDRLVTKLEDFGRSDVEFTWERVDATDELLAKAKKV